MILPAQNTPIYTLKHINSMGYSWCEDYGSKFQFSDILIPLF